MSPTTRNARAAHECYIRYLSATGQRATPGAFQDMIEALCIEHAELADTSVYAAGEMAAFAAGLVARRKPVPA